MNARNGQVGRNGGGDDGDMLCRTVIAAAAAMVALRLCQYLRKWLMQG